MCGIAASFSYRDARPIDRTRLVAVRDHMARRGPDDAGVWVDDEAGVALAHRRLSILDLSPAGHQPMRSADGRLAVVFNGELYNFPDLRRELEGLGCTFASNSDTEVFLHGYRTWGLDLLPRLRGMFAIALWDADAERLVLARDPYGIKPLYVVDDGRTLTAASQVRALRAAGVGSSEPDPAGHVGFFLWGHVPEPHTLFRDIRPVPAGHVLVIDRTGVHEARAFARVEDTLRDAERSPAMPADEAVERLHAALRESVRHHLLADVPVGVFLSSGLDSTTLAALTAEQGGGLRTVTLGFAEYRGADADEVPLAEAVARQVGAHHDTVWVTRTDFAAARDDVMASMDQPTIDGVNTYFVSRAATAAGLKVALSGVGGDELLGGYPSFAQVPALARRVGALPGAAVWGRGLRALGAPLLSRVTSPKAAGLFEYGGTYGGGYLLRRGLFMPWEIPGIVGRDLARAGWDALQTSGRLATSVAGLDSPDLRVTALESTWYMRHQLLRDTDWASMAHSLEIRTPLVDHTLLQQVAPLRARHPGAVTKRAMAMAPRPALPDAILDRPKTGFTIPVREWLLADAPDATERGYRGWARWVYRHHLDAVAT